MSGLTPDEGDDEAFPFIDADPPQLPDEVWQRSLSMAFDSTVEVADDLVPDAQLEDVYDEASGLDTEATSGDPDESRQASEFDDPLDQPGSTSTWEDSESGREVPSDATDYGDGSW